MGGGECLVLLCWSASQSSRVYLFILNARHTSSPLLWISSNRATWGQTKGQSSSGKEAIGGSWSNYSGRVEWPSPRLSMWKLHMFLDIVERQWQSHQFESRAAESVLNEQNTVLSSWTSKWDSSVKCWNLKMLKLESWRSFWQLKPGFIFNDFTQSAGW